MNCGELQFFRNVALQIVATGCLCLVSVGFAQEVNTLTSAETSAGYSLLFNGTNFTGWHAYREATVTDAWTIKSDAPLGPRIQNGPGRKVPILTNTKFKNFDAKIDVQTPVAGNSGIFFRYLEVATTFDNARSGPEFQICGPSHGDCKETNKLFGACYDMFAVTPALRETWNNPPGQWNQIRVIAYDSNYVHYGNGKKLLEYKIGTSEFVAAYNASKYVSDGNNGKYYEIHAGGILLQHHGEEGLTFRNLKAKELTVHPFKQEFPTGKWPDLLPQDFVFGNTTAARPLPSASPRDIRSTSGGEGITLVSIPFEHSRFRVAGLDGKTVPFRNVSQGVYSISRPGGAGIVIARISVGGMLLTRVISLQ